MQKYASKLFSPFSHQWTTDRYKWHKLLAYILKSHRVWLILKMDLTTESSTNRRKSVTRNLWDLTYLGWIIIWSLGSLIPEEQNNEKKSYVSMSHIAPAQCFGSAANHENIAEKSPALRQAGEMAAFVSRSPPLHICGPLACFPAFPTSTCTTDSSPFQLLQWCDFKNR